MALFLFTLPVCFSAVRSNKSKNENPENNIFKQTGGKKTWLKRHNAVFSWMENFCSSDAGSTTSVIDSVRTVSARICDASRISTTSESIKSLYIKQTSIPVNSIKHFPPACSVLYAIIPSGYVLFFFDWVEPSAVVFGSPCLWLGDTLELISRWDAGWVIAEESKNPLSVTAADNKDAALSVPWRRWER